MRVELARLAEQRARLAARAFDERTRRAPWCK
jgi:hypothetical protein